MGWMSTTPTPRPLRAAPPREPDTRRDSERPASDRDSDRDSPADDDLPPGPPPNIDDIPVGGEDVLPPSIHHRE